MPNPKNETLRRGLTLREAAVDLESRTVSLAVSSETPVDRWFGIEVLDHSTPDAIVMDRAGSASGLPLLWGHNPEDMENLLGRVTDFRLDSDRVLRGVARFGSTEESERAIQLIRDGVLTDVSVGYRIHEITTENPGRPDEIQRVTRWEPLEVSLVSVPADARVGVGRDLSNHPAPKTAESTTEVRMDTPSVAAPQVADPRSERIEALQLAQIARTHSLEDEAAQILSSDKPLAEARALILDLVARKAAQPLPAAPVVDMSPKEAQEYSYARALLGATERAEGRAFPKGFEDEVSETLARSMPAEYRGRGGVFVPMQVQTRTGLVNSSTAGAELVFTERGELIDLLRNMAAVIRSGARVLPGLVGPVTFPKLTADATVNWVAENPGSDMAASNPTLGSVTLSPKTMQGAVPFSRQLLAQSSFSVEGLVRQSLAAGHALAIDRAAIHGSGASNQPTGVYKTSTVNTKAMGGAPTYAKLQDMITEVAVDNALMGALRWLTTPGMAGKLAQTLAESSAGSDHIWTGTYEDGRINGYGAIATNQVSAVMSTLDATGGSSHGIIFGNWNDLMIGLWGAMELVVDPYSLKKQGLIEVASFQMADIQLRHPGSFCVATGATI